MATARTRQLARTGGLELALQLSGVTIVLREPTGADELLIAEYRDDPHLVRRLLERLDDGKPPTDWGALPVFDIDTAILRLRQAVLGDRVATTLTCAARGCGAQIDLAFGVQTYLDHHQPQRGPLKRRGWRVTGPDHAGWRVLTADGAQLARLRPPTLDDQIAVSGHADAPAALARRCVEPAAAPARLMAKIEAAMMVFAPPLAGPLEGRCPDCGAVVGAHFEARAYCLRELGFRARYVYEDVDALAQRYHWSERAILGIPYARRAQYAERARQKRA